MKMNETQAMVLEIIPPILIPHQYEIVTISTNSYDSMPFQRTIINEEYNMKIGDVGKLQYKDGKWTPISNYAGHTFELANVMGMNSGSLFVYGEKIGEKEVKKSSLQILPMVLANRVENIQPGHELLLSYTDPHSSYNHGIQLIHNISIAEEKYALSRRYQR